ncbi:hypothetical protein EJB05_19340, partial [Eragrostis curvula]
MRSRELTSCFSSIGSSIIFLHSFLCSSVGDGGAPYDAGVSVAAVPTSSIFSNTKLPARCRPVQSFCLLSCSPSRRTTEELKAALCDEPAPDLEGDGSGDFVLPSRAGVLRKMPTKSDVGKSKTKEVDAVNKIRTGIGSFS